MTSIRHSKIVLSGSVLEYFNFYSLPSWDLFKVPYEKRVASRVRRLINSNAGHWYSDEGKPYMPLFLTFTFAENVKDVEVANPLFTAFVKRVNYDFFGVRKAILKYTAVVEFQKRGAVHYHVLFYNVPFVEDLYARLVGLWPHGFIFVNGIKHIRNVGSYVVKYMTKNSRDERLRGKKMYFNSRGLIQPKTIKDDFEIADTLSLVGDNFIPYIYENEYFSYYRFDTPFTSYWPDEVYSNPLLNQKVFQGILFKN